MTNLPMVIQRRRVATPRRLILLASVAGLGAAALLGGFGGSPPAPFAGVSTAAAAEAAQRHTGFADLVEKVKPAVISVRVKMDSGAEMMNFEGDWPFAPN